jgi:hypothetical protein
LREASLSELTAMAKQKISNGKLLSLVMAANYEQVANFPVRIEAGTDDCTGKVHKAKNAPLTLMKYKCFLCGIPKARKTCKDL